MCIAAPNRRRYAAPNLVGIATLAQQAHYQQFSPYSSTVLPSSAGNADEVPPSTSSLPSGFDSVNHLSSALPSSSATSFDPITDLTPLPFAPSSAVAPSQIAQNSNSLPGLPDAGRPSTIPSHPTPFLSNAEHNFSVANGIKPVNLPSIIPTTLNNSTRKAVAVSASCGRPRWKRRRRAPQPPGRTATDKERLFVQHNYHDLSLEPDEDPHRPESEKGNGPLQVESFPMKLHRILDQIETEGLANIVSWQPHGRAFVIHDPTAFVGIIMPRYFPKIKKLTSLQRQLNLYGFERLTRDGPDEGAYYHESFLRGRPGLTAHRMVRKRVKGTGYKAASNPAGEPNFYSMPFMSEIIDVPVIDFPLEAALPYDSNQQINFLDVPATIQTETQPGYQFGTTDEDPGIVTESTIATSSDSAGTSQDSGDMGASWSSICSDGSGFSKGINQWQSPLASPALPGKQNYTIEGNPTLLINPPTTTQTQYATVAESRNGAAIMPCNTFSSADTNALCSDISQEIFAYDVTLNSNPPVPLACNANNGGQVNTEADDQNILLEFVNLWENAEAAANKRMQNQTSSYHPKFMGMQNNFQFCSS